MTMHGRWWINDPDCILLRTTTGYSDDEIIGIATVKAMSGGSFIISDDLATVPSRRIRLAQQLMPATNR
jgi:alpha-galactosidase